MTSAKRLPLSIKVTYTAFVAVLVPYYWHAYGPTNFLYFCDVALLLTLVGVWRESPLLISMPAIGITLPQALWQIDFLGMIAGLPVTGMTGYMFDPKLTLFTRGLSFFHFWLPFLLIWLIARLGYDRRAFKAWTVLAWCLVLICFFIMPAPPAPPDNPHLPVNINYVHGFSHHKPQEWMPPWAYLGAMMVILPMCIYWPTHLLLNKFFRDQTPEFSPKTGSTDEIREISLAESDGIR